MDTGEAGKPGDWRGHVGALALYGALSLGLVDHGVSITRRLSGQGSDPYDSPWFLAWWPWALGHHLDPFFTTKVWYPVGVNLNWITSVPFLAVLGAPLTLLAGPVVTYNCFVILAPILAAWFAYLLCFRLTRDVAAALIGGFLFGFSSYEMAQDAGALNLSFTCCVPALLLLVLVRVEGGIGRGRVVALGSLLLIAQFLICIEIFAMIFVFGAIAWGVALQYLPERRAALRRLFVDGLVCAPFVALPLVPFFVSMAHSYASVHHPDAWPYFFTTDLLNLVVPSQMNLFGAPFTDISEHFTGGAQEQDGYIGLPLLIIFWLFAREQRHAAGGRLLVALLLVFLVASFGPYLWVGGHFTRIALPWLALVKLPLLGAALTSRFALFVSLVAAMIAALWIAAPQARRKRLALGGLACVALLPSPHPWGDIPNSAFFAPGRVEQVLGANPHLLILPFSINGASSFWQQENQFGFTQTGGYLGFPPASMQHFAAVGELFGNFMGPGFLADFSTFCRATQTQVVVVGTGANPAMVAALRTLAWPVRKVDDVTIFTVPGGDAGR